MRRSFAQVSSASVTSSTPRRLSQSRWAEAIQALNALGPSAAPAPAVSSDDLRQAALSALERGRSTHIIRTMLHDRFGVKRVIDLPLNHWAEAIRELNAL